MTKLYTFIKRKINSDFALSGIVQLTICFFFLLTVSGIARAASGSTETGSLSVSSGFNSLQNQFSQIFDNERVVYDSVDSRYDTAAKKTLGQAVEVGGGILTFAKPAEGQIVKYSTLPNEAISRTEGITILSDSSAVSASANGFVSDIIKEKDGSFTLYITHSGSYISVYYNLERVCVSSGDYVSPADTVAYLAEDDRALGFSIQYNDRYIDPLIYIEDEE